MLEKYIDWDKVIIELLRNRKDNEIALQNLRDQYRSISQAMESPKTSDFTKDPIIGSKGAGEDAMVNKLLQKEAVEAKIRELTLEERRYLRAWEGLGDEDRCILQEFFQCEHRSSQQAIDSLCDQYGYERATIYRMRANALKRFKRLLAG
ncbi:MAG: hypothetical protein K0S60_705 [Evtepia sp.]|jgi:hypothetical protein|nr:hypothetical protein [Evtepia sp.]